MSRIGAIVAAACMLTLTPIGAAAHTPTREITQLRKQVAALRAKVARKQARIAAHERKRDEMSDAIDTLTAERDAARTELAAMTTARDNALAGLPAAIRAVPLAEFWPMVFTPARETWPCDSYYSSGGYWSIDFQSTSYC